MKLTNSRFWLLGAAYWIAVAALLAGVMRFWPQLQESEPFFYAAVLGALAGGFAIVYLFKSKS